MFFRTSGCVQALAACDFSYRFKTRSSSLGSVWVKLVSCVLPRENATVSRGTVDDNEGHLVWGSFRGDFLSITHISERSCIQAAYLPAQGDVQS